MGGVNTREGIASMTYPLPQPQDPDDEKSAKNCGFVGLRNSQLRLVALNKHHDSKHWTDQPRSSHHHHAEPTTPTRAREHGNRHDAAHDDEVRGRGRQQDMSFQSQHARSRAVVLAQPDPTGDSEIAPTPRPAILTFEPIRSSRSGSSEEERAPESMPEAVAGGLRPIITFEFEDSPHASARERSGRHCDEGPGPGASRQRKKKRRHSSSHHHHHHHHDRRRREQAPPNPGCCVIF